MNSNFSNRIIKIFSGKKGMTEDDNEFLAASGADPNDLCIGIVPSGKSAYFRRNNKPGDKVTWTWTLRLLPGATEKDIEKRIQDWRNNGLDFNIEKRFDPIPASIYCSTMEKLGYYPHFGMIFKVHPNQYVSPKVDPNTIIVYHYPDTKEWVLPYPINKTCSSPSEAKSVCDRKGYKCKIVEVH